MMFARFVLLACFVWVVQVQAGPTSLTFENDDGECALVSLVRIIRLASHWLIAFITYYTKLLLCVNNKQVEFWRYNLIFYSHIHR
jgi:hypothetical protein